MDWLPVVSGPFVTLRDVLAGVLAPLLLGLVVIVVLVRLGAKYLRKAGRHVAVGGTGLVATAADWGMDEGDGFGGDATWVDPWGGEHSTSILHGRDAGDEGPDDDGGDWELGGGSGADPWQGVSAGDGHGKHRG